MVLQKLPKNAPVCYGVAIRTAFAFSKQAFSSHSVSPKVGGMMTGLPVYVHHRLSELREFTIATDRAHHPPLNSLELEFVNF